MSVRGEEPAMLAAMVESISISMMCVSVVVVVVVVEEVFLNFPGVQNQHEANMWQIAKFG